MCGSPAGPCRRAEPVDARHPLGLHQRHVAKRPVPGDAGVGDQQVEPPRLRDEPLDGALHLLAHRRRSRRQRVARARRLARTSAATSCSSRSSRPSSPTRAPRAASSSAIARPMPREAPVTSADVCRPELHAGHTQGSTLTAMAHDHATSPRRSTSRHLLADGGGAADHRREHRPRDAALPADGARDGRPARAGRLRHARARTSRWGSPTHGLEQAEQIVGRHRLIERFLTDVVGIAWDDVHEEAERLEHAMSPALREWMMRRSATRRPARTATRSTRATAIPAFRSPTSRWAPTSRSCASRTRPRTCCTTSSDAGLSPGLNGESPTATTTRSCSGRRQRARVTRSVAETVSVRADPSPPPRTALPEQLVLGKERYGR